MASGLTLCIIRIDGQEGRQISSQADRWTDRQTGRQTDRQTHRQTDKRTTYHRGDGLGSDAVHLPDSQVDVHLPVTGQTADDLPERAHHPASRHAVTGKGPQNQTTHERVLQYRIKPRINVFFNTESNHASTCSSIQNQTTRERVLQYRIKPRMNVFFTLNA